MSKISYSCSDWLKDFNVDENERMVRYGRFRPYWNEILVNA